MDTDAFSLDKRAAIREETQRMQQLGGTVIDTAPSYGASEAIIGETLAALGIRDRMFIATKVVASDPDGVEGGQPAFDRSLKLLKTSRIDLLQVHDVADDQVEPVMPLMRQWKQAGKVRYLGISTSSTKEYAQLVKWMHKYPLDFVQVNYSIADRDAAANVLPLAMERRMAVLINIPFGGGGRRSVIRKALTRKLPDWATDIDVTSWAQFLLKYVIPT